LIVILVDVWNPVMTVEWEIIKWLIGILYSIGFHDTRKYRVNLLRTFLYEGRVLHTIPSLRSAMWLIIFSLHMLGRFVHVSNGWITNSISRLQPQQVRESLDSEE